jgi:hypothetical protein
MLGLYQNPTGSIPSSRSCLMQATEQGAQQIWSKRFMAPPPFSDALIVPKAAPNCNRTGDTGGIHKNREWDKMKSVQFFLAFSFPPCYNKV